MTAHNIRTAWQPKPLNRTGDLQGWKRRMRNVCPNPQVGQIVYLDSSRFDPSEGVNVISRTGYKCLRFTQQGEPIWQRGMTVVLPAQEAA
ncbi:hypothetical protein AB4524_00750 [Vibrio breoganii]